MAQAQQDSSGRFLPGNKGKKKGARRRSSRRVTAEVRDDILRSWDEMGGMKTFVQWGRKNYELYIKLLVSLMPKFREPNVNELKPAQPGLPVRGTQTGPDGGGGESATESPRFNREDFTKYLKQAEG